MTISSYPLKCQFAFSYTPLRVLRKNNPGVQQIDEFIQRNNHRVESELILNVAFAIYILILNDPNPTEDVGTNYVKLAQSDLYPANEQYVICIVSHLLKKYCSSRRTPEEKKNKILEVVELLPEYPLLRNNCTVSEQFEYEIPNWINMKIDIYVKPTPVNRLYDVSEWTIQYATFNYDKDEILKIVNCYPKPQDKLEVLLMIRGYYFQNADDKFFLYEPNRADTQFFNNIETSIRQIIATAQASGIPQGHTPPKGESKAFCQLEKDYQLLENEYADIKSTAIHYKAEYEKLREQMENMSQSAQNGSEDETAELKAQIAEKDETIECLRQDIKENRTREDEWYEKEYFIRFVIAVLKEAVEKDDVSERKSYKAVLLDITASRNDIPKYVTEDIKKLTSKNHELSPQTRAYGQKAIHDLCDGEAIIEYVEPLKELVTAPWESKWRQLWEQITSNDGIAPELAKKGKQQSTTFNRKLVCDIIAYLKEKFILEGGKNEIIKLLEHNVDSTIKHNFNKIENKDITVELDNIIKSLK